MKNIRTLLWLLPAVSLVLFVGLLQGAYNNRKGYEQTVDDVAALTRALEIHDPTGSDPNDVLKGSISGMIQILDPHSSFFDEKMFLQMKEEQKGSFFGIGVGIRSIDGILTVISPVPGTPAARAGIRPGDIISEINGEPTANQPIEDLMEKLRGPKGTSVTITIVREGYNEPFQVTLIRDEIPLATVTYAFMVGPHTGYMRLKSFGEKTFDEVLSNLKKLEKMGMNELIFDLRGNTGGLLEQAVQVLDLFLPADNVLVEVRGRGLSHEMTYRSHDGEPFETIPLVLLVNEGTASAAEIVSGAIQDHDRGIIVGESTWGKGLVQTLYPLSFGTAVAITTARYFTPSGRLIQRSYDSNFRYLFPEVTKSNSGRDINERYHTDLGRRVQGGGGIEPDIHVTTMDWPESIQKLYSQFVFFEYAKLYAPIEARGTEITHHSQRILLSRAFVVDDAMLQHFLGYLDSAHIPYQKNDLLKNDEWLRRALKKEILSSLWGDEEGYHYMIQFDPQFQKAKDELGPAQSLWNRRREVKLAHLNHKSSG